MKTKKQIIKWGRKGAKKRWSKIPPFEQRFWERVDVRSNDECWQWRLSQTKNGYGKVKHLKKTLLAHRVALEIHTGKPIPNGLQALHKCDNRPCCNPNHLFIGTQFDNIRDAIKKGRMRYTPKGTRFGGGAFKMISDGDVNQIRKQYKRGESQNNLAKKFGVNQGHISKIVNFKRRV